MPVYDYRCTKCGEKFEVRRSFLDGVKDRDRVLCPKCGSSDVERVYSPLFSTGSSSRSSCSSPSPRHFG
jgi:putative FmdB family regulatory protein